ncbi:MAG: LysE family translocator, partial [Vicinamibacterales bacterium]
ISYLTFTAILVVTPGSTTAVVVRNTLRSGRRAGLACAAGAAVANSTHATLAGLGLTLLVTRWPAALVAVRVIGAAYLAWLGAQSLWSAFRFVDGGLSFGEGEVRRGDPLGSPSSNRHADRRGFRDGLAINLANPAIISFYIAIVPSFVPAAAPRFYFASLAAAHVSMALVCHSMWALALHAVGRWFASPAARRALTAATGLALVFLAARVLS